MTVNYGGSAGGQPRLFIPSMGQFQDPAVQTAMQQILQWANTLKIGGTPNGGAYGANGIDGSGNLEWVASPTPPQFSYLQSDNETFVSPSGVQTIMVCVVCFEYTTVSAETFELEWSGSSGIAPAAQAQSNLPVGTSFLWTAATVSSIDNTGGSDTGGKWNLSISGGSIDSIVSGGVLLTSVL
jgi:hypothetical protein